MQLEDDFMWVAGNTFSEMRLLVEGAITLFEDDAGCLCRLARDAGAHERIKERCPECVSFIYDK